MAENKEDVKKLRRASTELMLGTADRGDMDVADQIKDAMQKISATYRRETGNNIMEFYSRVEMLRGTGAGRGRKDGKGRVNVNDMVSGTDQGVVNDIFYGEKDRIQLYFSFNQIYDLIPQMAMALDTFVDNIISPDDFTKTAFNAEFVDAAATPEKQEEINKKLDVIVQKYELERFQPKIIRQTLRQGDYFVAVLHYEEEMAKMLKEDVTSPASQSALNELHDLARTTAKGEVSANEAELLTEFAKLDHALMGRDPKKFTDVASWENEIRDFVNESVVMSRAPEALLVGGTEAVDEIVSKDFKPLNEAEKAKGKQGSREIGTPGAILRMLDPSKIVKLTVDNVDYGYYYVDTIGAITQFGTTHSLGGNRFKDLITASVGAVDPMSDHVKTAKLRLVTNVFARNIAQKIDRKFVKDNPEFKNIIYGMLKTSYDAGMKLRVTYIPPDRMIHFRSEGDDIYGRSIYTPILFTAKLYLASLISTLMQKLVRAPEKRIFYIETGLDEDTPGAIQSFVKSIKSKEFKVADLGDITSALNSVGTFNDLYVPMQNGEKTIEVDNLPGTDVSIENDFLDYLRRSMISGLGIPASFLGYSDEVEFARSLTMQNGRFTRSVISWQHVLAKQFTDMVRQLYVAEHGKTEGFDMSEVDKIVVKFPKPMTLLSGAMNDMTGNVNTLLDFITNAVTGETEVDPEVKKIFRLEALKNLMPGVDWEEYTKTFDEAVKKANVEAARKKAVTALNASDEAPPIGDVNAGPGGEDIGAGAPGEAPEEPEGPGF